MNLYPIAQEYVSAGLSVLPITQDKLPFTQLLPELNGKKSWKPFQSGKADESTLNHWFNNGYNVPKIAIICGKISGNLELIDVDMKADPDKQIWDEYVQIVEALQSDLLEKLVIETTVSGGYHIIYRCEIPVPGNQKLAKNTTGECLLETRGEGGYFVCAPSPGYELKQGSFTNIPVITKAEREILINAALSLNRHVPQTEPEKQKETKAQFVGKEAVQHRGISPFDDFNERGDALLLLKNHGWTEVFRREGAVYLRRPGKDRGISASFGHIRNAQNVPYFYVFSTSTVFDSEKIYFPYAVYALLEHGADFKAAARALLAQGYGKKTSEYKEQYSRKLQQRVIPTDALAGAEAESAPPSAAAWEHYDEFVSSCLNRADEGDAELFALLAQDKFVHDASANAWYHFDGHWKEDRTGQILCLLPEMLSEEYSVLLGRLRRKADDMKEEHSRELASNPDAAKQLAEKAKAMEARCKFLKERITKLHTYPYATRVLRFAAVKLGIYGDTWDSQPHLLGCANGVIDLRDGSLREAKPTDYIRKIAPTHYDPDATAPRWEQFFQEIFQRWAYTKPNPSREEVQETVEIQDFVYKLLGYSLLGEQQEHIYPILWGAEGRNGKDTLLETLSFVLGPSIASSVAKDVVVQSRGMSKGQAAPELYDLWGKRLVWVSETNETDKLNAAQLKLLSGGGAISCRPLYGNQVTFQQTHLLMLITNHKPLAPSDDQALWERIALIEFRNRFVDEPDPNKPNERPADKTLKETLRQEASGILTWLVKGCKAWRRSGLTKPNAIKMATNNYRNELDGVEEFFTECVETVTPSTFGDYSIKASDLYKAYTTYCESTDLRRPCSPKKMTMLLQRKNIERQRKSDGWHWFGIRLKMNV